MHFGEPGNVRYLRPIWAVLVVDALKKAGAKPFLCDTTVLYASPRKEKETYLQAAYRHGYHPEVVGCPVVIAGDNDDVEVDIPNHLMLPKVAVNRVLWEADYFVSLAHATLHLQFPMAASLKNIGMGCASRATKKAMHGARGKEAIYLSTEAATMDLTKAIIRRYSKRLLAINVAMDITPDCDCWNKTDLPIVPDQGIFISEDPVAADKAVNDLIIEAPAYPGSKADRDIDTRGMDKSENVYPDMKTAKFWEVVEEAGCGSLSYQLIKL
ncbi:hypothetical protein AMJ86_05625 [bacterium SM23_57]|nr:MAG: hypothetical protein AMJ86_05625 [bacterium SM23_57]